MTKRELKNKALGIIGKAKSEKRGLTPEEKDELEQLRKRIKELEELEAAEDEFMDDPKKDPEQKPEKKPEKMPEKMPTKKPEQKANMGNKEPEPENMDGANGTNGSEQMPEKNPEKNPEKEPEKKACMGNKDPENRYDDEYPDNECDGYDDCDDWDDYNEYKEYKKYKEDLNKRNITKMNKKFSLIKAIRSVANGQPQDSITKAVLAAGAKEMRSSALNYTGQIQLPGEARASITVDVEGEDVVATDLFDIVKPIQNRNVMAQAGAKFITGLVGDVQYPVMSKGAVTWEGETTAASAGEPTFTNVKLTPKRLTAVVALSKQMLAQDSVGVENAVREEIINAVNAKLESTILGSAAGSNTQPAGLLNGTPTTITDFAGICDLEAGLDGLEGYGEPKYIVSPKAKAALRGMAKGTKSTQLVFEDGEIDGTQAFCTAHLADKNLVYGDFGQYVIAQWGAIDITVDNVTLAAEGQVRLVVNCYFDAKPLRSTAIVAGKIGAASGK